MQRVLDEVGRVGDGNGIVEEGKQHHVLPRGRTDSVA